MSKCAIILGGAGFIGSHLCVRLLQEGCDVICIDERNQRDSPLLKNLNDTYNFHYLKHDITEPYEIRCDELYNLATPLDCGVNHDFMNLQRLSAFGSFNTLDMLVGSDTRVLYGSSDDVYNFEKPDIDYQSSKKFVAEAKRFGEAIHRAYHTYHNIDTRIARIYSTYGTHACLQDQHVVNKMIIDALNNHNITVYGSGQQVRTFCYVDDMVTGLISLMRAHSNNGFLLSDVGSSHQITIRDLAEMIINLTGSRSGISHREPLVNEPHYKIPRLRTAKNEVKWEEVTSLKEGLQRTINYIEKELSAIAMSQMSWVEVYG